MLTVQELFVYENKFCAALYCLHYVRRIGTLYIPSDTYILKKLPEGLL